MSQEEKKTLVARGVNGFTLLECLVAVVILALAWFATIGVISPTLLRLSDDTVTRSAIMYAGSLVNRVGADIALVDGVTTGNDRGLDWRIEITPYANGVAQRVTVSVSWRRRGRVMSYGVDTVRLAGQP